MIHQTSGSFVGSAKIELEKQPQYVYSEVIADSYTFKSANATFNNIKSNVYAKGSTDTSGDFDISHIVEVEGEYNIVKPALPKTIRNSNVHVIANGKLWEPSITYHIGNSLSINVDATLYHINTSANAVILPSYTLTTSNYFLSLLPSSNISVSCHIPDVAAWYRFGGDIVASAKVTSNAHIIQNCLSTNIMSPTIIIDNEVHLNKYCISDVLADWITSTVNSDPIIYRNVHADIEQSVEIEKECNIYSHAECDILPNVIYSGEATKQYNGIVNVECTINEIDVEGYLESWSDIILLMPTCNVICAGWHTGDASFNIENYCQIDAEYKTYKQGEISVDITGGVVVSNPYLDAFWIPRGITERLIYVTSNSVAFNVAGANVYTYDIDINNNPLIYVTH
jgi:hypothetical protein